MSKLRVGHKQNSFLNGEWAGHVREDGKKHTSRIRRNEDKKVIKEELALLEGPDEDDQGADYIASQRMYDIE